ncbi:2-amino-4-hydroxy-6-hydroxymethyldihydropteridine diphosphokinase [Lysobacter brunescens]|uniref:2-amino-4-hydroxy-6-hydroxymethyldihydropteridine pyrophosphokinase n=1 Tax=Lysobacter brunescens TaxID=262323 RepID=A0ABW2YG20_9GAMM
MSRLQNAPVVAFIGLGGNLGDPLATLRSAVPRLMTVPRSRFLGASRFHRTPAWGERDQADFVNAVVAIETALAPKILLDELLGIERQFGRQRGADGSGNVRWGPRTLDLDILLYGAITLDTPSLKLPHPHLHERAFALVPLLELVDDIDIPGQGSARAALARLDRSGIQALAER